MTEKINNKNDRKEYFKKYFEENKEKLNEDFICEICGGKYKYMSKTTHEKTKKHIISKELQKYKNDNEKMKNIISEINKKFEDI